MESNGTKNLIVILCILFSLVIGLATAYSYQGANVISSPISIISSPISNMTSPTVETAPVYSAPSQSPPTDGPTPIPVPPAPVGPCCIILNTDETWNLASETCNESESGCYSCGGTWMDEETDENWEAICLAAEGPQTEAPCCVNLQEGGKWSLLEGECANSESNCVNTCQGAWINPETDQNWAEICSSGEDLPQTCCIDLNDDGEYTYLKLPYDQNATTCFNGGGLWIDPTTDENASEICSGASPVPFVPSPTCPCLCSPSGAPVNPDVSPTSPPPASVPAPTGGGGGTNCDPNNLIVGCDNSYYCTGVSGASGQAYYMGPNAACSASNTECTDNNTLVGQTLLGSCSNIGFDNTSCKTVATSSENNMYNIGDYCPQACSTCTKENFIGGWDVSIDTTDMRDLVDPENNKVMATLQKSPMLRQVKTFAEVTNLGDNLENLGSLDKNIDDIQPPPIVIVN